MKAPLWLRLLFHPVRSRLLFSDMDAWDAGLGADEWQRRWRFLVVTYWSGTEVAETRTLLLLGNVESQMAEFYETWLK